MIDEVTRIDEAAEKRVSAMIERVRSAGLTVEAEMFETVYWGWLRTISAYSWALPFVDEPDPGFKASGMLNVTTYTINHWGPQIPGSPVIDNDAVRRATNADAAWHAAEDRRMRREAGEEIL